MSEQSDSPTTNWKDAVSELDGIVASFDDGHVAVDELIEKLNRAVTIIETLEARLTQTEAKLKELAPRLGGDTK
jgi:exodeoxyribonuclease VII small subunit